VNFGGGFKVAITPEENDTPIEEVDRMIGEKLIGFYEKTGRKLQAELEPGKFVVMSSGVLVAEVDDIVDTGSEGYRYVKLNTGMSDFLRPALYASEHVIEVVHDGSEDGETGDFVVVGHCCESTDVLTVAKGDSSKIRPIRLENVKIGSLVVIRGAGAYCAGMRAVGFNGFPPAEEVFV
jgi:diaminopimelate decarboxylase